MGSQAVSFVKEKYGRDLAIGEVRINPFLLQVEIRDFMLPDADGVLRSAADGAEVLGDGGATIRVEFTLEAGSVSETVTVVASATPTALLAIRAASFALLAISRMEALS